MHRRHFTAAFDVSLARSPPAPIPHFRSHTPGCRGLFRKISRCLLEWFRFDTLWPAEEQALYQDRAPPPFGVISIAIRLGGQSDASAFSDCLGGLWGRFGLPGAFLTTGVRIGGVCGSVEGKITEGHAGLTAGRLGLERLIVFCFFVQWEAP